MASSVLHLLAITLCCSFLFFLSHAKSLPQPGHRTPNPNPNRNPNSKPSLLVLPVQQDASTGLHWATLQKRTPLTQVPVLVDLNGKHLWVNCDQHYSSQTYQAPFCHSTQCSRANTHQCLSCNSASKPGCHRNTCGLMSTNPVTEQTGMGELGQDVLGMHTTTLGSQLGPMVTVPQFLFSCAPSFLVQKGLPNNVQGVAGLGHTAISLPNQLASHFGLQHQFTTCLSRNPISKGAILFGDAPNNLHQFHNQDIFHDMAYTPLTVSPQGEYNVRVTAIRIAQQNVVPANPTSANMGTSGIGGTMISTATPYTALHHTIYQAFNQMFAKHVPKEAQVKGVAPFELCYDSRKVNSFPCVDFVMDTPNVVWKISAEELTVQPQSGITCLGFVNGGLNPKAAITIGAHQLEEKLVVFDLARSRLGFSTSLRSYGHKCSDLFDFTNL
ncbi:hypothetical protein RJT34_19075 [Clitoria ternatea]|uniref:SBg7S n=1 Tax=Clitoria ternatea TaxID=43366 RepID=A0AAN9P346_CLITE